MWDTAHLPRERSSFIGRTDELATIAAEMGPGLLVTLSGPGGCGKTRLALRLVRHEATAFGGQTAWVDLEEVREGDDVGSAVARAVGLLVPQASDPLDAVVHGLRSEKGLLVLDNCEHVLGGVGWLVERLRASCPDVGFLATSRAPLNLHGERVIRVGPMNAPDALELLLARIDAHAGSRPDEQGRDAARRVCDKLDRLPLALELAAGWAETLTLEQIATDLLQPHLPLARGAQGGPPRQQTLDASIAWSYELLTEHERMLLRALGIFEAGFSADAVMRLGAAIGLEGTAPLQALRGLIDKSLVVAEAAGPVARYRMMNIVQAFAQSRAEEAGEVEPARDCHLDLYLGLVEDRRGLLETDRDLWREQIRSMYPNIRAAIEWGLRRHDPTGGSRLAAAVAWLWHLEDRGHEGIRLLRRAVERGGSEPTPLRAEVVGALALVADTAMPGRQAYDWAIEASQLARSVDVPSVWRLSSSLAAIGLLDVDPDEALVQATAVLHDARACGDDYVVDACEALIGLARFVRDDYHGAIAHLTTAVEGLVSRGDRGVASSALGWLALSKARTGQVQSAARHAEQAVLVADPLRDFHRTGASRCVLAHVRILQGRVDDAAAMLEQVNCRLAETDTDPFIPGWEQANAMLAIAQGRPSDSVAWCRREAAYLDDPVDAQLTPDTRLLLAVALRLLGRDIDAARVLDELHRSSLLARMPRLRADVFEQQAELVLGADGQKAVNLHYEALRIRVDQGLALDCIRSLERLGCAAASIGREEFAEVLLSAAVQARYDTGTVAWPPASLADTRDRVEGTGPSTHADERTAMNVTDAVQYALRMRGPRRRPDHGWESLTPTERSVVALAVQGLTNPQIGEKLFMGRGTVKTHLRHVYQKLQVENRTQLATVASERTDLEAPAPRRGHLRSMR